MTLSGNPEPGWPLRRAKAAGTRLAIITAASELFVTSGYEGTTVHAVAAAAGVSRATVFNAVGGKAALLKAAYDVATVGDDEQIPLPERPELLRVRDEPDPQRMIELYAALIAGIGKRLSGIYEVFRAASASDEDITTLWTEIQEQRLQGARGFVNILRTKTRLPDGLDPLVAGDIVWTLIDASLYQRLCHDRGWPHARFQLWLADTLSAHLLPSRPKHRTKTERPESRQSSPTRAR